MSKICCVRRLKILYIYIYICRKYEYNTNNCLWCSNNQAHSNNQPYNFNEVKFTYAWNNLTHIRKFNLPVCKCFCQTESSSKMPVCNIAVGQNQAAE